MAKKSNNDGIRLVRHSVSVYEVEVDLGKYADTTSREIKGFANRLIRIFPGLRRHECYAGEQGGFVHELRHGTDLAHVMEHLILEMLKMACGGRRRFTGWTRKKGRNYVIHFQAPDGSMGKCAASNALELIEDVIEGNRVRKQDVIRCIRDSREARN
jgi:cyanophycin synthetase